MSDFLLDFRVEAERNTSKVMENVKHYPDMDVSVFENTKFCIVSARPDDVSIWGSYSSGDEGVLVVLSGRIAMDDQQWARASEIKGVGGTACKAIYRMYREEGRQCFSKLNGNFVVLICDFEKDEVLIGTDRCGMDMCFLSDLENGQLVLSSNPDLLASSLNTEPKFDLVSMAEFLTTGRVSFPNTYYKGIEALEYGALHIIDLKPEVPSYESCEKFHEFQFEIDNKSSEWELAEELAHSFKKGVSRRTSSRFGKTAIALSGGLDSRVILCSADKKDDIIAFCFHDEENLEYRTAKAVAKASNVTFLPLKRDFDYYGNSMEMGARISGGMGSITNNHFLGFRDSFKEHNIENIVAGFYCDYLFKGLVLDHKLTQLFRREEFTSFSMQNYLPHFFGNTQFDEDVRFRLDSLFPMDLQTKQTDQAKLEIAFRRSFPFYYEPDSPETVIPQRVLGWSLPIVDNDILDVYRKIPPSYKLNASIFSKMTEICCGESLASIINANTGTLVNAGKMQLILSRYKKSLKGKVLSLRNKGIATQGSWPNWCRYMLSSDKIRELFERTVNHEVTDILSEVLGAKISACKLENFLPPKHTFFLRILTLKIWLEERVR